GELAQRIVTSIVEPFVFEDGLIGEIGTSIGIALAPDHATDRNTLLQRADIAMYAAKRGSTSIAHYDARLDPNSVRQLTLGGAVRQAVEDQELSLELQPQLQLQNGRIDRVEALLRWHHPTRGLILPAHFVPQSEHSGRIHEITEWSIEEAVRLLQLWHERPLELTLALNISARSFEKRELAPNLLATLEAQRVDPKKLILEITESALLETAGDAGRDLEMLHQAGIRLAIDDFGTGYSSLSLLRNLPIDELKIDQSFVGGLMGPGKDQAIVRSTIDLAHSLGLVVVAEGVEHQEQLDTLRQLSCDYGQGFLIAPAMDMQTFEARYLAQESA
ncbi:MAG: GGDEF domain-containing phosphodiesterase, partial [Pseudomonadota bacterium]